MTSASIAKKRSYAVIFLIFCIFALPLLLAGYFYNQGIMVGKNKVNHGQLIIPPRDFKQWALYDKEGHAINTQKLMGHWLMVYVIPQNCRVICQKELYEMRQIHIATGKNQDRVQRVVVAFKPKPDIKQLLEKNYPDVLSTQMSPNQFQQLMAGISTTKLAVQQGSLYLVDPRGNIMMDYTLGENPEGIWRDLERLLRVSQIG